MIRFTTDLHLDFLVLVSRRGQQVAHPTELITNEFDVSVHLADSALDESNDFLKMRRDLAFMLP